MSAQDLSALAGIALSLIFSYVPGVREKWAAQSSEFKSLGMLAILFVLSAAIFGGSCAGWWSVATCDREGVFGLLRVFVAALIANQGAYLISPPLPKPEALVDARDKRDAKLDAKKLALLLLPVPLLLLSATTAYADSDNAPLPASTFPGDELYCLAAATHTEAASQSAPTKAAVARWILVRAIETRQTVCGMLQSERTVIAAHAPAGTWAHDVFHNGDLLRRQRGAESWLIAMHVYDSAGIGEQYEHFDSCDSRAAWTDAYERVRLEPTDSVCLWR